MPRLHPYRHVLLLERGWILWAPALRGVALTEAEEVHRVLSRLLPRLRAGGEPQGAEEQAVFQLLEEGGYLDPCTGEGGPLQQEPRDAPTPASGDEVVLLGDGPLAQALIRRLPSARRLNPGDASPADIRPQLAIAALDGFSVATFRRARALFESLGASLRCYALAGDGEGAWIYATRPGEDPCLECFLARWLSGVGDSPGLRWLVAHGPAMRWQPFASPEAMAETILQALEHPGQALLRGPSGDLRVPFLPAPTCRRCRTPERARRQAWLGHPMAVVKEVEAWEGKLRPPVFGARLGWVRWCTGGEGEEATAGCAWSPKKARRAAVGEALERYAASWVPPDLSWDIPRPGDLPGEPLFRAAQRTEPGFPYPVPETGSPRPWLTVYPLGGGSIPRRAPAEEVLLLPEGIFGAAGPALSHGLACGKSLTSALRMGLLERLERDATALFWVRLLRGNSGARRVPLPRPLPEEAGDLDLIVLEVPCLAGCRAFVAFCRDPDGRIAAGAAARTDPRSAAEKAVCECLHNRYWLLGGGASAPSDIPGSYEEHGGYYWHRPRLFPWKRLEELPRSSFERGIGRRPGAADLARQLKARGYPVFYRELTPPDVRSAGFRVVRVLAPGLLYPPAHHRAWPRGLQRWREEVGDPDHTAPTLPHPFA